MHKNLLVTTAIILLILTGGWLMFRPQNISYNKDIRPIFNKNCLSCHGGIKKNGEFSLLFPEEALDTTESGLPAIIPGDGSGSELVKRLKHHDPNYGCLMRKTRSLNQKLNS